MNLREFRGEIEGEWLDSSPEKIQLRKLAREYIITTDKYDAAVCTGNYKGIPFPADWSERRKITQNANQTFKSLKREAEALGFTGYDLHREIRSIKRYTRENV